MFLLYLHAISVSNSKASAADASHGLHMDFSTKVNCFDTHDQKNMLDRSSIQLARGTTIVSLLVHVCSQTNMLTAFLHMSHYCFVRKTC